MRSLGTSMVELRSVVAECGRVWKRSALTCMAAALIFSVSSPAEARRKRHGGYTPPYASMVVDVKTGRVLQGQNEDAPRHPASITKVMTLYLLFEQLDRGRLRLDTPLRISANAARQAPSKLGFDAGDTIEVQHAIKALVTKSANDVAVAVAENIGGSEEDFADLMTRKAKSLGMTRTVYRNASGLPNPEQTTTARDLTILARAIQDQFPQYYHYFQTRYFVYNGKSHRNHNKLLGRVEGVDGIKTGYTRASGFNLMTSAKLDGRHVVAVVLGGRSGSSRDHIMASLVENHMPRAYAGTRSAPVIAEAQEKVRPAVVAEIPRSRPVEARFVDTKPSDTKSSDMNEVDTTATTSRSQAKSPLDLAPFKTTGLTTTTPSSVRAYAPVEQEAAPSRSERGGPHLSPPLDIARPNPANKDQARLQPLVLPPKQETASLIPPAADRPKDVARSLAQPFAAQSKSSSSWMIQLGATDEESKARAILDKAKSNAGRSLASASAFTEKVQRDGSTLYRARFSGFDEADDAQEACRTLKKQGFACFATRG
jgi:D-alanyl-D-alanine carboxypeptidase